MNWRTHAISLGIFLFIIISFKVLWDNPKIILYFFLGGIALLAYGAIFLIVKSKTEKSNQGK